MRYDFETPANRQGNGNMKGGMAAGLPNGTLFLAGAEMDFGTAPCIRKAITDFAGNGLYGFTLPDADYRRSVIHWMKIARNWHIEADWIVPTLGTVSALSTALRAFTKEGDGVIIQHPSYYRLDRAVLRNHRQVIPNPMMELNGTYSIDWEDLEAKMKQHSFMILVNPHNPTSHVFPRSDLERIASMAQQYHVLVFSDEIYAESAQPGHPAVPYSSLDPDSITSTALGKTFNLTGVNHANLIIPSASVREKFYAQQDIDHFGSIDPFFYTALRAAYTEEGLSWVQAVNRHVMANYELLRDTLAAKMPLLTLSPLEGTFIVWMDCRRLGADASFFEKAGVIVDPGEEYGPYGKGFVRFNIACPTSWIQRLLDTLYDAYVNAHIRTALEALKNEINGLYGYEGDTPRINYGPCGVFADLFHKAWNLRFKDPVHIVFVMTKDLEECYHVCICLPDGSLYDGGIGIHNRDFYKDFMIMDMLEYDHDLLEKWSYGLDRTYPRYCPDFDRDATERIIIKHLSSIPV